MKKDGAGQALGAKARQMSRAPLSLEIQQRASCTWKLRLCRCPQAQRPELDDQSEPGRRKGTRRHVEEYRGQFPRYDPPSRGVGDPSHVGSPRLPSPWRLTAQRLRWRREGIDARTLSRRSSPQRRQKRSHGLPLLGPNHPKVGARPPPRSALDSRCPEGRWAPLPSTWWLLYPAENGSRCNKNRIKGEFGHRRNATCSADAAPAN